MLVPNRERIGGYVHAVPAPPAPAPGERLRTSPSGSRFVHDPAILVRGGARDLRDLAHHDMNSWVDQVPDILNEPVALGLVEAHLGHHANLPGPRVRLRYL